MLGLRKLPAKFPDSREWGWSRGRSALPGQPANVVSTIFASERECNRPVALCQPCADEPFARLQRLSGIRGRSGGFPTTASFGFSAIIQATGILTMVGDAMLGKSRSLMFAFALLAVLGGCNDTKPDNGDFD